MKSQFQTQNKSSTCLLTYLLTAWKRVLLEKVIGCQLVKKFPTFYGTRRFITALTGANYQQTQIMANVQYIKINSKFYN